MNLYIDESGSFAYSPNLESWNVVAAIATAESAREIISAALRRIKQIAGVPFNEEVKINRLDERTYLSFLQSLDSPDILLFATFTDAGLNTIDRVVRHQTMQVTVLREAIPRMRYDGGRLGLKLLADQIERLSPQLYVQLVCQVDLVYDVINRSINYFAQRKPRTLRELRWRIDQKNRDKPTFEEIFEKITPPLLQVRSIGEPMARVNGFNYTYMNAYEFEDGKAPDYLQTEYGLPAMNGFDVQKMVRGNLRFVDSKSNDGVQAVDLLASGLMRLFRGRFNDHDSMAQAFGRLTLQNRRGLYPVSLTTFSETEATSAPQVAKTIRTMLSRSKRMLATKPG